MNPFHFSSRPSAIDSSELSLFGTGNLVVGERPLGFDSLSIVLSDTGEGFVHVVIEVLSGGTEDSTKDEDGNTSDRIEGAHELPESVVSTVHLLVIFKGNVVSEIDHQEPEHSP